MTKVKEFANEHWKLVACVIAAVVVEGIISLMLLTVIIGA